MPGLKTRLLLGLSGLILLGVGVSVLFSPVAFFAGNGVTLPGNPSLMSEVRAPGTLLLVTGLLMLTSAVRAVALQAALGWGALVYACYGLGRVLSLFLDGLPSAGLVGAAVLELLLAGFNGAAWLHHRLGRASTDEPASGVESAIGFPRHTLRRSAQ